MAETKATRKPSGVKSESAGEAAQIRKLATLVAALDARCSKLEAVLVHVASGNLANAKAELER